MKIIVIHYVHYDYHKFTEYLGACLPEDLQDKLQKMIWEYIAPYCDAEVKYDRLLKLPVLEASQSPNKESSAIGEHFALTLEEI